VRSDLPPPLVPIAAALIVGAACGGERPGPVPALVLSAVACAAAAMTRRRRRAAILLLAVGAWGLGALAQATAWRGAAERHVALFRGERVVDRELRGRVIAAPERRIDGSRSLLVEAAAEEDAPRSRIRLDVAEVPGDDLARFEALRCGDTIRAWCRLRDVGKRPGTTEAGARRAQAAQRLDATARVKSSRLIVGIGSGPATLSRAIDVAHVAAIRRLDRAFDPDGTTRAVLGAMLLGDRGLLTEDLNAVLRDAGLVHLLSISGLHTAMTVLLLLTLFRRAGIGPRGLLVSGGAALLALAAFVGHGASVWRACGSLGAALIARALGRDVDALAALALSAAALVLAVPPLAWNAGFLLSVTATAGLVACVRPAAEAEARGIMTRMFAASAGAYAATLPLVARLFGRAAPAALAANLAAAPLCAACLGAGAAAVLVGSTPGLGPLVVRAAEFAVGALLLVARWAGALPGGHLRVASPSAGLVALYVTALLAAWLWRGASRGGRLLRLLAMLAAIAIHIGPPPPGPGPARVEVLDVGQGLSVLLRGPSGGFALYDAGPAGGGRFDSGDRIVIPALSARGCRRLDVLVLSHDHDDHAGGARAVLRDLEVGELWLAAGSERDRLTRSIAAYAVECGVAVRRIRRGDAARLSGLRVQALHPGLEDRRRLVNDRCLALRIGAEGREAVILPGDLEAEGERALLRAGADVRGTVLVAPHHGADGSSTAEFLAAVHPRWIVVSAGEGNRFGHPGAAALSRYAAAGARIARTDRDGTVAFEDHAWGWQPLSGDDRSGNEGEDEDGGE
jgi:competence protein ComEC